jgi:serine/threonine protein kinase
MTRPLTAPGRLVAGRYRLQSQIGGGGMGAVWLAQDELLGRRVAVKQVLTAPGVGAEEADQQRQRALREGRIAARLSHPHAISVYDVALEHGQPWLVMEYLPSRSLAEVLTEDGVLRVDQAAQIGAQVADALAATHAAGIVHRDVKPANILIGEGGSVEGLVKITDFGISHASGDVTLTQTGQITGTPAFLAPEVAQGRPMTEASDVFSLGATLYTCLEGAPPFGMEDNALGMLHRVAGGNVVPPRRSGALTQPLQKILAADPADRPTMPQVRDELATLAAGRGGDTTTILLARTDVGSTAPDRNRTASFPAGAAAVGAAVAAEPVVAPAATTPRPAVPPMTPPPRPPRDQPQREPARRGGRGFWIAAALIVLVVGGLIALSAIDPFANNTSDAQGSSGAGASSPAPQPTTQPTEPSTKSSAAASSASSAAPPTDAASVKRQDVDKAVKDFFSNIPKNLQAAYQLTSPGFQGQHSFDNFAGFWNEFSDVKISNIQSADGSTQPTLDIQYVFKDGRQQTEHHVLTFVVGDGGKLLLDSDVQA